VTKDSSRTGDAAKGAVNGVSAAMANLKVTVRVTAAKGISYSGPEEPDGIAEKGDEVRLPLAVAQLLIEQGDAEAV
jgi:hypothetical protein